MKTSIWHLTIYFVAMEYLFGHRTVVRLPLKFPRLLASHPILEVLGLQDMESPQAQPAGFLRPSLRAERGNPELDCSI